MIIVKAARLDRRGVGAAGGGGTHRLGDDFVILGTYLNGPLRTPQRPMPDRSS